MISLEGATDEKWRPVRGYKGRYDVSSFGRVRSLPNSRRKGTRILVLTDAGNSYLRISLAKNGKSKLAWVHRLVLEAFKGPAPKGFECGHLDGSTDNNRLENLKWVSAKENARHKIAHGTTLYGERAPACKLTWKSVKRIRELLNSGIEGRRIAKAYDVHESTINKIKLHYTWKI